VFHVGAGAEVPPVLSEGVEGDRFLEAFKDLELVGLVLGLDMVSASARVTSTRSSGTFLLMILIIPFLIALRSASVKGSGLSKS
jgi:hypothetical protein